MNVDIIDNVEVDNLREIIINITKEIDNDCSSYENEVMILNKYPELYDKYTFIIKKICKKDDVSILYEMLENINNINNGIDSLSNVEKNLGGKLAKTYLTSAKK